MNRGVNQHRGETRYPAQPSSATLLPAVFFQYEGNGKQPLRRRLRSTLNERAEWRRTTLKGDYWRSASMTSSILLLAVAATAVLRTNQVQRTAACTPICRWGLGPFGTGPCWWHQSSTKTGSAGGWLRVRVQLFIPRFVRLQRVGNHIKPKQSCRFPPLGSLTSLNQPGHSPETNLACEKHSTTHSSQGPKLLLQKLVACK